MHHYQGRKLTFSSTGHNGCCLPNFARASLSLSSQIWFWKRVSAGWLVTSVSLQAGGVLLVSDKCGTFYVDHCWLIRKKNKKCDGWEGQKKIKTTNKTASVSSDLNAAHCQCSACNISCMNALFMQIREHRQCAYNGHALLIIKNQWEPTGCKQQCRSMLRLMMDYDDNYHEMRKQWMQHYRVKYH